MPPRASARRIVLGLALLLLAGACLPTASAAVEGEVRFTMTSLEEAGIEATLELIGAQAEDVRQRADHDGDGEVGALEEAGAEQVLGDRLEGDTDAYALDGTPYTVEAAGVDAEDLRGPANRSTPVTLHVEAEAQASPGEAPHTFELDGLLAGVDGESKVAHAVTVPEGYRVGETTGIAEDDGCTARTEPGTTNASVELSPADGACPQGIPAPGLGVAITAVAAVALVSRRARGSG